MPQPTVTEPGDLPMTRPMTPTLSQQLLQRKPTSALTPDLHEGARTGPELKRTIGTFQLTMIGVGSTIGTGIFIVMSQAVPLAGPGVILSFVIAGIAAGLSALCYAELASTIPVSGSTYSYAYHSLGELAAMGIAACLLLEYGVSTAAVAVGWSEYLNDLFQQSMGFQLPYALSHAPDATEISVAAAGGAQTLTGSCADLPDKLAGLPCTEIAHGIVNLPAVILVLMCALLLIRGASESAKTNAVMVMIKLTVLVLFIIIAFSAFKAGNLAPFAPLGVAGITAAASQVFFSFIGLDAVSTAGEEVKDPQRTMPRAILLALAIVIAFYLLVAIAALGAQQWQLFQGQEAGLAQILRDITGKTWPGIIFAAGAVISIFSVTLVTLYGQTRILFAMGRDGMLPKRFAVVNPRTQTPVFNTIVVAVVVSILAAFIPLSALAEAVSIGTLAAFIVVAIGVLVLRRIAPGLRRGFKVPGYPVTPVLTVLVCLYVLKDLRWQTWLVFGIWLTVVLAFYLLWGRRHSALNSRPAAASFLDQGPPQP